MLYIRADGNAEIGTGHVMRCLSIAGAARSMGRPSTFLTADREMEPLLNERGFPSICLDTVWNDLDRETEIMEALIREQDVKTLLIDSYFVTREYLSRLHRQTRVVYMDDLNAFHYPCSMLINYNIYAEKWDYPGRYPDAELLLGPTFAPLREEFQNLPPRQNREQARSVLLTTGGSDPYNIAGQVVQLAKQTRETRHLTYHIVAGRFNQHLPMLEQLKHTYSDIFVHRNVRLMAALMLECDIAVSAGGSTLYELCACGTPTICFAQADNQLEIVAAFGQAGMYGVGDVRTGQDGKLMRIVEAIVSLQKDAGVRQNHSLRLQTLVDGGGAARIAARINL